MCYIRHHTLTASKQQIFVQLFNKKNVPFLRGTRTIVVEVFIISRQLTVLLPCFSVQIEQFAKSWTPFRNNGSTTIRKYSSRAFIWVTLRIALDSSGFRSFGLVKFAFSSDGVRIYATLTHNLCSHFRNSTLTGKEKAHYSNQVYTSSLYSAILGFS